MKPIVLALVGPTGVGKTQVSLDIARALNAEILSMDSMQVYRGMDIGTAKSIAPKNDENIAHYMIDIADPHACFTVADYREQAISGDRRHFISRENSPCWSAERDFIWMQFAMR